MAYAHTTRTTQKERIAPTVSDDFGLRKPRHSETVFAKKRYTLIQFTTILGAQSFRKHFRQKEVYLDTIYDDFGLRSPPRHSENVFARKRYTLTPFTTISG